jgi:phytoene synthase
VPVAATPGDIAYANGLVRAYDRPRYYATLFAPAALRDDLFALYGFAAEIARVPDQVREAGLGEIRLKWWSDALSGVTSEERSGTTPALRALASVIAKHRLPIAPFEAMIEARIADLYSDPPPTIGDLEGRMGETESVLFQLAAMIAGGAGPEVSDAAGHAGVAYGIARRLTEFASDRARGRTILPADVLHRAGLTLADVFAPDRHRELEKPIADLIEAARQHLVMARNRAGDLPRPIRTMFLPLAVVKPLLARIEALGGAISEREARVSDLGSLLRIGLARLR